MPVSALLDLELRVPDPDSLCAFWNSLGLVGDDGILGTSERPSQLRVQQGPYRHVSEMRLGCDDEADLPTIRNSLDALGINATISDGVLRCHDPLADHVISIEVSEQPAIIPPQERVLNRPGTTLRANRRSEAAIGSQSATPRRVGHVVFGTTDVARSTRFYNEGLGFRISDRIGDEVGTFLRCSSDHHNLLLMPSPVPCLNHYAVEMDDVDAIGIAGMRVVRDRPGSSIYGIGRHVLGANLFWYLLDPAGGMFELFSDMDQITDDAAWEADERRDDWDPFTIAAWEPGPSKPDFFLPADIEELARAREAAGR